MDAPNPFNAAFGAGVPVNPLDLGPEAVPPSSAPQPAAPQPAPLPQSTPTAENAPAGLPAGNGTNPEQPVAATPDDIDAQIARFQAANQQDTSGIDAEIGRFTAANLVDQKAPENGILKNWTSGFIGRMLDITGYNPVEPLVMGMLRKASEFALSSVSPDMVPQATKDAFIKGLESQAGKHADEFKTLATKLGVPTQPDQGSMAGEMGSQSVDALLFLAGIAATAPLAGGAAAGIGLTRTGAFLTRLGDTITQAPVRAALTEILGATPGAVIGEHLTGSPWGSIPAAMAGGGIASIGLNAGRGLVNALPNAAIAATEGATGSEATNLRRVFGERRPYIDTAVDPIYNQHNDPERARQFAEHQMEGAELRLENSVLSAVNRIREPANADPRYYQKAVYNGLEAAEQMSNRVKNKAWGEVDTTLPIKLKDEIKPQIDELRLSLADREHGRGGPVDAKPGTRPLDKIMDKIDEMGLVKQEKDAQGRFVKGTGAVKGEVPIQKLIDLQQQIFSARKSEEGAFMAGHMPNRELIANYNKVSTIIWDAIGNAYPQNRALQFARDYSVKHHDMFSRGVIADVLASNRLGERAVNPEQTVDAFLKQYNGLSDMFKATRKLGLQTPVPGTKVGWNQMSPRFKSYATTNAERGQLRDLRENTLNSVRAEFHQFAQENIQNPVAIQKYLKKIEPQLPRVAMIKNELQPALQRLDALNTERKTIEKSALARFAGQRAESAIQRVMNSGDGVEQSRQLMVSMRGNPDAINALRDGVIDHIYKTTQGKPMELQKYVGSERVQQILGVVMDPGRLERLNRMVNLTARLESGDIASSKRYWLPTSLVLGRVAAAGFAHFIGVNTIQGTGLAAQSAKQLIIKAWGSRNPAELFINAIRDPVWEKFVLSKAPDSFEAAKHISNQVSKLASRLEATRQLLKPGEDKQK